VGRPGAAGRLGAACRWGAAAGLVLLLVPAAGAAEIGGIPCFTGRIIDLEPGPNLLDLNGDGTPDVIFKSWNENHNAHSFNSYLVSLRLDDPSGRGERWETVRLDDGQAVAGGALVMDAPFDEEAVLREIAFAWDGPPGAPPLLVLYTATRQPGDSLQDAGPVDFVRYELVRNADGDPGRSRWYFAPTGRRQSQERYSHAGTALAAELGVPTGQGPALGCLPGRTP
jgi:hypothetical protein